MKELNRKTWNLKEVSCELSNDYKRLTDWKHYITSKCSGNFWTDPLKRTSSLKSIIQESDTTDHPHEFLVMNKSFPKTSKSQTGLRLCSELFYWPIKKNRFIRVIIQESVIMESVLFLLSHTWSAGHELSNGYKRLTDWKHSFMSQIRESFWLTH